MPGENVYDWSVTAADNGTADSLINWQEGQARATVNNSARSMLAAHAKFRNLITGLITTGGSATAMTFVSGVGYTAIPNPMRVLLKVGATNAVGTTLNMDGIGDIAIKTQRGDNLVGGEMRLGSYAELIYNGTNWVLISNAIGAIPVIRVFAGSTTYVPGASMIYCIIECVGGGGGGGGAVSTNGRTAGAGGGGSGAYSRKVASAATIGASQVVTIGAGGTGGTGAPGPGGVGGTTSVGTLCRAVGGQGGDAAATTAGSNPGVGGAASGGIGDLRVEGAPGTAGMAADALASGLQPSIVVTQGGGGGSSLLGGGARTLSAYSSGNGAAAPGYGGGGGGARGYDSGSGGGAAGGGGVVVITEYLP